MDSAILVQNIKSYCKAKGVPPTVACKEAKVGGSFINDIERGQVPSVGRVQQLADYLGCTVSDLLGEKKEPDAKGAGLTAVEQGLIDLFRLLSEEQQDMVIRVVEAASDKQKQSR